MGDNSFDANNDVQTVHEAAHESAVGKMLEDTHTGDTNAGKCELMDKSSVSNPADWLFKGNSDAYSLPKASDLKQALENAYKKTFKE